MARAITANGRDLEGAVNRLLAHATLTGSAITLETAETAIRDLVRNREPKRVKIEDIQKLVASHYNVSPRRHPVASGAPRPWCARARSPCICRSC